MTTFRTAALAALISTASFGAASAATITTFSFDTANSGTRTALSYTVDGLTLDLTTTGGAGKIQTWRNSGLGAPRDSHHQVDSKGIPETINLSFDRDVKITNITFNPVYVQSWDRFALSQGGTVLGGPMTVLPSVDVTTGIAQAFGIGAVGSQKFWTTGKPHKTASNACYKIDWHWQTQQSRQHCFSAFKITSVTVEWGDQSDESPDQPGVVPLPAAGWMLLAGLGGIAAIRRRRKAA